MAIAAPTSTKVHYKTARIGDLDIFYRDAGPKDAPVLLLLHGFPTSSNMFRQLIPRLASSFRLIAPDYPSYGQSGTPDRQDFAYTFANMADLVDQLLDHLKIRKYALYVMDYRAPIGYRLALLHPERISGLVIQNTCPPARDKSEEKVIEDKIIQATPASTLDIERSKYVDTCQDHWDSGCQAGQG